MTRDASIRRKTHFDINETSCPWREVGLAPGFLELIERQGRAWARELEMAPECCGLLDTLTGGSHELLRQVAEEAVVAGFCPPNEAVGLVAATAPDEQALCRLFGEQAWTEVLQGRAAAVFDEPDLAASISNWPIRSAFPRERPPAEWQRWERLAHEGELAAAARKVLAWLLYHPAAPQPRRGAKP